VRGTHGRHLIRRLSRLTTLPRLECHFANLPPLDSSPIFSSQTQQWEDKFPRTATDLRKRPVQGREQRRRAATP